MKMAPLVLKAIACIVTPPLTQQLLTMLFQKPLLENIKANHPSLEKVYYFSDGCAGQYKNFINLCHKEDFGFFAEWNFFATSHGKSVCDRIGGTAKRL